MTSPSELKSRSIEVGDALEAIEFYYEQGWTDGLPVVPPTPERVAEFLRAADLAPDDVIGVQATRRRIITAEKIAINAVMAGCLPQYMPVVVAAVQGMLEDQYLWHGCGTSTMGAAMMLIVNGPIRQELGMNARTNAFSPGWRPNATIGRAIRLIMINVVGFKPGLLDMGTFGHPGRYSFCVAEDEEGTSWEPLHVERGFSRDQSCVTVFAALSPIQIMNEQANTPPGILDSLAASVCDMGSVVGVRAGERVIAIAGQHRQYMERHGWSKKDVREYLFEKARVTPDDFRRAGKIPRQWAQSQQDQPLPVVARPDDYIILACGGHAGGFSMVIPPWGGSRSVTKPIGVGLAV